VDTQVLGKLKNVDSTEQIVNAIAAEATPQNLWGLVGQWVEDASTDVFEVFFPGAMN